jgi:hypothetical protein
LAGEFRRAIDLANGDAARAHDEAKRAEAQRQEAAASAANAASQHDDPFRPHAALPPRPLTDARYVERDADEPRRLDAPASNAAASASALYDERVRRIALCLAGRDAHASLLRAADLEASASVLCSALARQLLHLLPMLRRHFLVATVLRYTNTRDAVSR